MLFYAKGVEIWSDSMAKRGAKAKPVKLHELNGNPSKRDISKKLAFDNMIDRYEECPAPPKWIKHDKYANEEWNRMAPILVKLGVLTKVDISAFESYCKCYSRYRKAEEEIDNVNSTIMKIQKSGYVQALPQVAIAQQYLNQCKKYMAEFGMLPSSRNGMELPNSEAEDEMEKLMRGDES